MWKTIEDRLPDAQILLYAFLTAIVPLAVYTVNRLLHKHGDPPWKKREPGDI